MTETEVKSKLESIVEHLKSELAKIRTGRVSPALLDPIKVDAYGSMLTIKEIGSITSIDAQTLQVNTWDKGLKEAVYSAIKKSDLNLNPSINGDNVIVPVPSLTEERRKEFTKIAATKVEEAKQVVRSIRQDVMKDIEKRFDNKEFGEDEKYRLKEKYEKIVKDYATTCENLGEEKKSELMDIG